MKCTFLVVTSGNPSREVEAHLVAEDADRARARAVLLARPVASTWRTKSSYWVASLRRERGTGRAAIARGPEVRGLTLCGGEQRRLRALLTTTQPSNSSQPVRRVQRHLVVPAAVANAPHGVWRACPSRVSQSEYVLPSGRRGSPDTRVTSASFPRIAASRAIEAVAPESPVIAIVRTGPFGTVTSTDRIPHAEQHAGGEGDRSDRGVPATRKDRDHAGPAGRRGLKGRRQLGRRPRGEEQVVRARNRSRSGSVPSTISSKARNGRSHLSLQYIGEPCEPAASTGLDRPERDMQELCDLTLGESRRSTRGRSPPARSLGQRLERTMDAPGVP